MAALLAFGLAAATTATAEDGLFRISATLLDDFAAALEPLTFRRDGVYTFRIPTWFGPVDVPVYCVATASITGISFQITPANASVRANVTGTLCGLNYSSTLATPVTISVDPSGSRLRVQPAGSMPLNATTTILGIPFTVPFNMNLAPSLTVLSIPIDAVSFQLESPGGSRALVLVARNHQVTRHNGYFEISADVHFR
jgi:hypothetical protein